MDLVAQKEICTVPFFPGGDGGSGKISIDKNLSICEFVICEDIAFGVDGNCEWILWRVDKLKQVRGTKTELKESQWCFH